MIYFLSTVFQKEEEEQKDSRVHDWEAKTQNKGVINRKRKYMSVWHVRVTPRLNGNSLFSLCTPSKVGEKNSFSLLVQNTLHAVSGRDASVTQTFPAHLQDAQVNPITQGSLETTPG